MTKRKKKPSPASVHKTDRAQHKNEFFRRLKHLVTLVSNPTIYSLLPEKELEKIYRSRFRTTRIRAADGEDIPAGVMKDSKQFLSRLLKIKKVPVLADGKEISRDDFFTIGLSLATYLPGVKESDYAKAKEVKEALAPFLDFTESDLGYKNACNELVGILIFIHVIESDLSSRLYILKLETRSEIDGKPCLCFCLEIYAKQTEKIQVLIDGHNRPALRVGWGISEPAPQIKWIRIKAEDLNLDLSIAGLEFDVYIQSHALIRLAERMDCVIPGILHYNIFISLSKLKVYRDKNGNFLFEYRLYDKKAGYLRGDICEGRIIIRTFLFLTNTGTPEGEKLEKSTGLLKEDRKYLAIDKLSTFIKSDISGNERVKEIFIKAGCGSLFEMDDSTFISPEEIREKSTSELIAKYLGLEAPGGLNNEGMKE